MHFGKLSWFWSAQECLITQLWPRAGGADRHRGPHHTGPLPPCPPQDHASMLPSSIPPSFFQLSKIHQSLGAYSAHSHLEKYLVSFNSFVTSVTSGSLGRQKLNYYNFMRKQKIFLLHKTLFVVAQNIVILCNKLYGRYPKMFP